MLLKNQIKASSIAEVVIALSVIALCIGIAALVFFRVTKTTSNFQDVKRQTEIQSMIWKQLYQDQKEPLDIDGISTEQEKQDSLTVFTFKGTDDKIVWKQHWIRRD